MLNKSRIKWKGNKNNGPNCKKNYKLAKYCFDFQIPCFLPMHSYCISQLSNNLCPVFFLKILWWNQSGDYLAKSSYDKNNKILLYSFLPTGTYHKKFGEFGQNFPWKSFVLVKVIFSGWNLAKICQYKNTGSPPMCISSPEK